MTKLITLNEVAHGHEDRVHNKIDIQAMTDGEMIAWCGDSGERWSTAFLEHNRAHMHPHCFDPHGLLCSWFRNAIEAAWNKRLELVLEQQYLDAAQADRGYV